jgi:hypothetical protein
MQNGMVFDKKDGRKLKNQPKYKFKCYKNEKRFY